jgi:hypothetical protein
MLLHLSGSHLRLLNKRMHGLPDFFPAVNSKFSVARVFKLYQASGRTQSTDRCIVIN